MPASNRWKDHYSLKARSEKWLARSVYKLEEIDRKNGLFQPGHRVLDLGCFPGSWSQYCIKRIGNNGGLIGIDLKKPERFSAPNFRFIQADLLSADIDWIIDEVGLRDIVISDMAPNTSGNRISDTRRSMELAEKAFEISLAVLKNEGHFLCKIFEGDELYDFRKKISGCFKRVRLTRPSAIRKGSREIYLLGLNFIHL
ncbi:MAG: RlmE family RNA methyltransferase [Deltaproteobacteria bacterium]|nr:RlmE family RNA methyltransferase [Deltaproteobacteria bacterium]